MEVYDYLTQENIPLLLEIPFKKEIAELYSVGKIASEKDFILEKQLFDTVENIILQYGSSYNKR